MARPKRKDKTPLLLSRRAGGANDKASLLLSDAQTPKQPAGEKDKRKRRGSGWNNMFRFGRNKNIKDYSAIATPKGVSVAKEFSPLNLNPPGFDHKNADNNQFDISDEQVEAQFTFQTVALTECSSKVSVNNGNNKAPQRKVSTAILPVKSQTHSKFYAEQRLSDGTADTAITKRMSSSPTYHVEAGEEDAFPVPIGVGEHNYSYLSLNTPTKNAYVKRIVTPEKNAVDESDHFPLSEPPNFNLNDSHNNDQHHVFGLNTSSNHINSSATSAFTATTASMSSSPISEHNQFQRFYTKGGKVSEDKSHMHKNTTSINKDLMEHERQLQEEKQKEMPADFPPAIRDLLKKSSNANTTSKGVSQEKNSTNGSLSALQTKALLTRSFGRTSLPPHLARKWVVEVSPAEWDNSDHTWKYRILVQQRRLATSQGQPEASDHQSFTAAFTWRSLESFCCLEQNLKHEYNGALFLPLLNIALGTPDINEVAHEVDSSVLQDWLSDILNGVRGQGELLLDHESAEIVSSEAMEAFLYRNTSTTENKKKGLANPADTMQLRQSSKDLSIAHTNTDTNSVSERTFSTDDNDMYDQEQSFVQSFIGGRNSIFSFMPFDTVCGTYDDNRSQRDSPRSRVSSFGNSMSCSPGLSSTLRGQDSFMDIPLPDNKTISHFLNKPHRAKFLSMFHGHLLEAQSELALSYRRTAMSVMERLQNLMEEEAQIGLAWKRFAIAVSNLFAYEKDVETARLGDKKIDRDHMPYRKVNKSTVDDCLRVMAKQKVDRAVPSLKVLTGMIMAYIADLSAVKPSVDDYLGALYRLALLNDKVRQHLRDVEQDQEKRRDSIIGNNWQHQLRDAFAAPKFGAGGVCRDAEEMSIEERKELEASSLVKQKDALQNSLSQNGGLLKSSLTTLFKVTSIRVARMAWAYLHSEVSQCALIHSAALSLRTKIDVANVESVAKMISRHHEQEKEDASTELALIQRIVNLGTHKKYPIIPSGGRIPNNGGVVEVDTDAYGEETSKGALRDKALQLARERVGRWDAKMALAVMEAVGVDDANIRVEETTRELRMVRKYAIGLRENLNRCIEAVDLLRKSILNNKNQKDKEEQKLRNGASVGEKLQSNHISDLRKEFLIELSKLFSGNYIPEGDERDDMSQTSKRELEKAGIFTNDPMGWASIYQQTSEAKSSQHQNKKKRGQCGEITSAYMDSRDGQTEWLLKSLDDLLEDYNERVQAVESFVYMECIGIQLEKYFSQKRAKALADFEKKTDITTAINVATRKGLGRLVKELQAKLFEIGSDVTHTSVKESKEAHLESKQIKLEIHELALRRLLRARETSTERVVSIISLWAKEEEALVTSELKALGDAMRELEHAVGKENFGAYMYRAG